uniref:Hexosyltransferase n=1 Tax=Pinctada fucata TaxID=50426 RepID=A0A1P8P0H8_PINFU|nr:chondroitin sulfate synthase-1 [Pinctada fucata]
MTMSRRRYLRIQKIAGLVFGIFFGILLSSWCRHTFLPCGPLIERCCIHINYHLNIVEHAPVDKVPHHVRLTQPASSGAFNFSRYIPKDEKGFLLIGVITAKKFLNTRAVAAYDTWTNTCNGICKVIFFSSEGSVSEHNIPIVSLPGVDDSYPPQRKSLMMLKYLHDHYVNNFEWFMRADDDVFIKGDRMEKFLRSINSSVPQYIGQAGTGKREEYGKLYLGKHENFCMGGPGIVMSHVTLRLVAPHAEECVNNLMTTHEDVEVGRCVRKFTGLSCTWAFEMQHLFYQNYKEEAGSFRTTLKDKGVRKSLTLHSVKDPRQQYRIHNYLRSVHIQDLHHKEILLQREVTNMERLTGMRPTNIKQGAIPSLTKSVPSTADEVLAWEFISKAIVSHRSSNPRHGINYPLKVALEENINQLLQIINKNARQKGRTIDYKEIWYGYKRVNPLHGADYMLDLLLTYKKHKGRKITVPVRRHAYLQQTFGAVEFIEDPYTANYASLKSDVESPDLFKYLGAGTNYTELMKLDKSREVIHFILPLAGRLDIFKRFISNYEEVCLKTNAAAQLHVVLFNDSDTSSADKIIDLIGQYQKKYGGQNIEIIFAKGPFARAKALDIGASQCEQNALMFFIDVDIIFSKAMLHRIRFNTKLGVQVYYPIVFSQYDPTFICSEKSTSKPCHIDWRNFTSDMGYWRNFGFGIASMYNSDLSSVGGFDTSIQGWGKEDVDLYTKFAESRVRIFRAVDPDLVHAFHPITCDSSLNEAQSVMCIGSKASSYASTKYLAKLVKSIPQIMNRKVGSR